MGWHYWWLKHQCHKQQTNIINTFNMHFLKCSKCGHFNEVKTEYLMFCSSCNKKLENNFSDWQVINPDKSFDDFKQLICISEEEMKVNSPKEIPKKSKGLKYLISFAIAFAIFYAIGQLGGEAIVKFFKNSTYDRALMEVASELNKTCPFMVDSETRLDNALALPNNVFQYNYTLVNISKESVNIEEARNSLEPSIVNVVKTNPDMKYFRDHKTTINYSYKDKTGVFILTITVKPEQYQ